MIVDIKSLSQNDQVKAIQQYFPALTLIEFLQFSVLTRHELLDLISTKQGSLK